LYYFIHLIIFEQFMNTVSYLQNNLYSLQIVLLFLQKNPIDSDSTLNCLYPDNNEKVE